VLVDIRHMDDELKALRARLSAVQHDAAPKATRLITERVAIELIALLQQRGKLDLVYTCDGREFLTREQVAREVREEVASRGGRRDVCELPAALNVEPAATERAVRELAAADPATFRVHEGEIITQQYHDHVAALVRAALASAGYQSIAALSKDLRLSFAYVHQLLRTFYERGELPSEAVMDEEAVYTPTFVVAQRRRLMCALLGCAMPTRISEIAARHKLYAPLIPSCVEALAKENLVRGRIEGTGAGAMYTPAAYENSRIDAVETFYATNGFVPYATAVSFGISNPKQYLLSRFGQAGATKGTGGAAAAASNSARRGAGGGSRGGRGRAGGATAAASVVEEHTVGHALRNGFLADRVLRALEPALETLVTGTGADATALLDTSELFPPFVSGVEEDQAALTARLLDLFPAVAAASDVIGPSLLLRKNAWAGVDKVLEGTAKDELTRNRKVAPFARPGDVSSLLRKLLLFLSHKFGLPPDDAGRDGSHLALLLRHWAPRIDSMFNRIREDMKSQRSGDANAAQARSECTAAALQHWTALLIAHRSLATLAPRLRADLLGQQQHPPSERTWSSAAVVSALAGAAYDQHAVPIVRLAMVEATADLPAVRAKLLPLIVDCVAPAADASMGGQLSSGSTGTSDGDTDDEAAAANANVTSSSGQDVAAMVAAVAKGDRPPLQLIADVIATPQAQRDAAATGHGPLLTAAWLEAAVGALAAASASNTIRITLRPLGNKEERHAAKQAAAEARVAAASAAAALLPSLDGAAATKPPRALLNQLLTYAALIVAGAVANAAGFAVKLPKPTVVAVPLPQPPYARLLQSLVAVCASCDGSAAVDGTALGSLTTALERLAAVEERRPVAPDAEDIARIKADLTLARLAIGP
jgi:hypothetical protein